jgi:hypothetical protein
MLSQVSYRVGYSQQVGWKLFAVTNTVHFGTDLITAVKGFIVKVLGVLDLLTCANLSNPGTRTA